MSKRITIVGLLGFSAALFAFIMTQHAPVSMLEPAANRYITGENYLSIKTNDINIATQSMEISISWDASWRDRENWDAAWVVLKGETSDGLIEQLNLADTPALANPKPDNPAEFYVPADETGFFIYRSKLGEGDNDWQVKVTWRANEDIVDVQAYSVEMVYVPEGAFELGTTRSLRDRKGAPGDWLPFSSPSPLSALFMADPEGEDYFGGPYQVTSEQAINIGTEKGNLYYLDAEFLKDFTSGDKQGTLSGDFPKGFASFYQMKYEVTEQQYVDLLNCLTPQQAEAHWENDPIGMNDLRRKDFRHTIHFREGYYRTEQPQRAVNFISWKDGLAWADWMALRPMTGLEFEKSARGPLPAKFREFVWGLNEEAGAAAFKRDTKILEADGALARTENGDEVIDGNVHVFIRPMMKGMNNLCTPLGENYHPNYPACRSFKGPISGWGPMRVGIHGIGSEGDRIKAGAGYYGSMELSGNLLEQVITLGHPQGRAFRGTHGDGQINERGEATNKDWGSEYDTHYYSYRGAGWVSHANHARTADRFGGLKEGGSRRSYGIGFRAVRTFLDNQ